MVLTISRWLISLTLFWFPWEILYFVFSRMFGVSLENTLTVLIWGTWTLPSALLLVTHSRYRLMWSKATRVKLLNFLINISVTSFVVINILLLSLSQHAFSYGLVPHIHIEQYMWTVMSLSFSIFSILLLFISKLNLIHLFPQLSTCFASRIPGDGKATQPKSINSMEQLPPTSGK